MTWMSGSRHSTLRTFFILSSIKEEMILGVEYGADISLSKMMMTMYSEPILFMVR
jgi:hypothetical protein